MAHPLGGRRPRRGSNSAASGRQPRRGTPMSSRDTLGGIIHTYQKYDPVHLPGPNVPPPDVVSHAFEHLLFYGNTRRLTEEELARAIRLDASQIRGFMMSLEALRDILLERKRKILSTYETDQDVEQAALHYVDLASRMSPPAKLDRRFQE